MDGGLHESYGKIYKAIKKDRPDHVSSLGGECFDDNTNYLGKLVLPKVTRKETSSSASFRETLGIS